MSPWFTMATAIVSGLLGIFAGPILEARVAPLTNVKNLPIITFALSALVAVVVMTLWAKMQDNISAIKQDFETVVESLGMQAQLLSYDDGYLWLQEKYSQADSEILIFTNYLLPLENDIEYNEKLKSPSRVGAYKSAIERVEHFLDDTSSNFRVIRIVRIPPKYSLNKIIQEDDLFYSASVKLVKWSKKRPEFASLRLTDIAFRNTFVIVDKTSLYIELDTELSSDENSNVGIFPPYSIVIEDPSANAVKRMRDLFLRMEAQSKLVNDSYIQRDRPTPR